MSNRTNTRDLNTFQAIVFLCIPLILFLVNGCRLEKSISDYANVTPLVFAFLLTLSGRVFFDDGFVSRQRWYNIIPGIGLFGVVLFLNTEFPILHYAFAGIFFLGSLFNMVLFSSRKQRPLKILVALFVLFGMSGHYLFGWYSLFWAEWIGMVPISVHYVLELFNRVD